MTDVARRRLFGAVLALAQRGWAASPAPAAWSQAAAAAFTATAATATRGGHRPHLRRRERPLQKLADERDAVRFRGAGLKGARDATRRLMAAASLQELETEARRLSGRLSGLHAAVLLSRAAELASPSSPLLTAVLRAASLPECLAQGCAAQMDQRALSSSLSAMGRLGWGGPLTTTTTTTTAGSDDSTCARDVLLAAAAAPGAVSGRLDAFTGLSLSLAHWGVAQLALKEAAGVANAARSAAAAILPPAWWLRPFYERAARALAAGEVAPVHAVRLLQASACLAVAESRLMLQAAAAAADQDQEQRPLLLLPPPPALVSAVLRTALAALSDLRARDASSLLWSLARLEQQKQQQQTRTPHAATVAALAARLVEDSDGASARLLAADDDDEQEAETEESAAPQALANGVWALSHLLAPRPGDGGGDHGGQAEHDARIAAAEVLSSAARRIRELAPRDLAQVALALRALAARGVVAPGEVVAEAAAAAASGGAGAAAASASASAAAKTKKRLAAPAPASAAQAPPFASAPRASWAAAMVGSGEGLPLSPPPPPAASPAPPAALPPTPQASSDDPLVVSAGALLAAHLLRCGDLAAALNRSQLRAVRDTCVAFRLAGLAAARERAPFALPTALEAAFRHL